MTECIHVIECMIVVFIYVMKCRAASRNQFKRKLTQMKDHSITGKQQRMTDQSSQDEEREVYASSPLTKLHIHASSLYTSRIYIHMHFHRRKSVYTLEN